MRRYMAVLGTTPTSLAVLAAARGVVQAPVQARRQPFRLWMTVRSSGHRAMIYAAPTTPNTASPRPNGSSSNL